MQLRGRSAGDWAGAVLYFGLPLAFAVVTTWNAPTQLSGALYLIVAYCGFLWLENRVLDAVAWLRRPASR